MFTPFRGLLKIGINIDTPYREYNQETDKPLISLYEPHHNGANLILFAPR